MTKLEVRLIVDRIKSWNGKKLTWDVVVGLATEALGRKISRQTLCKYQDVADRYELKRSDIRKERPRGTNPEPMKRSELAQLRVRVRELKETVEKQNARFFVWSRNAYLRGLTEEQLNAPLGAAPRPQRDALGR